MFHGSVMGKIVTPINVSDEKRPSGNTRRRATYTVCTGKDGYGKNSHFCNMDMVAIGGAAYEAEKKLHKGDHVYVVFHAEAADNDGHFTFYVDSQRRANCADTAEETMTDEEFEASLPPMELWDERACGFRDRLSFMSPPSRARARALKCSHRGFIPTLTEGIYSLLIYSINILFTIILSIYNI